MRKYNVGDIVTTTETLSRWGTTIPTGPKRVCELFEQRGEVGIEDIPKTPNRNYVLKVNQVQPYAPTFKPGDVVEVLRDCEDPLFHERLLAGTKGAVHGLSIGRSDGLVFVSTTEYDDTHNGYFSAKPQHLRLVSEAARPAIKAGDWVTTDQTSSHYGSKVPAGPLYVHQVHPAGSNYLPEPERAHVGSGPTKTADDVVIATRYLTPTEAPQAKPGKKDEPKSTSPFKVGDRVRCDKHFPVGCDKTTVEGEGTVTDIDYDRPLTRVLVLFDKRRAGDDFAWYIDPTRLELAPPRTKAGTGWTFRIPAGEPIDGKRVLKELADAGADYAVVAWGKRDDQRLCLVSQRLLERAKAAGVTFKSHVLDPKYTVEGFGHGFVSHGVSALHTGYGWAGNTTLAALEDYAKRVKAAEKAKRPTTVRVNFGVAK
jgi:hypothetical protein